MKTLGVYTKDFSLYYDLLKILRLRKIPYVSLDSLNHVPSKIGVILTSNSEFHDVKTSKVIAADAYDTVEQAVDLAMQMLIGKDLYSKIYIGIDPGDYPGVAVVGDDILLTKISVDSPDKVFSCVKRILKEYLSIQTIIRIGNGSIIVRNRIVNSLIKLGIPIEIVDETKTTPGPSSQISRPNRDSEAAAIIALMRGGRVQSRLGLEPTRGEIIKIQEKSRKLTNGMFSISEKTAIDVINGKISLEEAINRERNCN